MRERLLLTKDEEERHQVPVQLAAHTSLSDRIVRDRCLQLCTFLPHVHTVDVDLVHVRW